VIFGQKVHNIMMNKPSKFHPNPMHGFRENGHHHLQPICLFLKICDVGISDFWCGEALE
jgi:hypothetical protein